MNGIAYSVIIIFIILLQGCKNNSSSVKESIDVVAKEQQVKDSLTIDDIALISTKDTLYLTYDSENLGKYREQYVKYKNQYETLLISKKKLSKADQKRFENFDYNDLQFLMIRRRIELHNDYKTVILNTPEHVYILFNYNSKGELVDFLDLAAYNQLICNCKPTLYIDDKGIIHGYTESGYPYYPYVWYKVNDQGKFEIFKSYTSPLEDKMSAVERLDYNIKKVPLFKKDTINLLPLDIGPNDPTFSASSKFAKVGKLQEVLFSNSQELFNTLKDEGELSKIFKENKAYYLFGKSVLNNHTVLISYIQSIENTCILFSLDNENEIKDVKQFVIDGNQGDGELYITDSSIKYQEDIFTEFVSFTIDKETGEFIKI